MQQRPVALAEEIRNLGLSYEDESNISGKLVRCIPVNMVMQFLSAFQNHPQSYLTAPGPVRQYISDRSGGELSEWDVFFSESEGIHSEVTCVSNTRIHNRLSAP